MRTDRRSTPTIARRLPALALAAALPLLALLGCDEGDPTSRTVAGDRVAEQKSELPPPTPNVRELTATTPDGAEKRRSGGDTVIERPPLPEPVTYAAAESVYHEGDYGEAVRYFEAYVERKPENPWGQYMLGLSAWKAGRDERAVEAFEAALERDPEHVKSLVNLSRVLLELDRADQARATIDRALAVDPSRSDVLRVAGNVALELGEHPRAGTLYRRAVEADGTDAWSMNNLGLVLIRQGRFEDALLPLARAVELRPETPVFRNNLGVALERTGHLGLASESYRIASEGGHGPAGVSLERVERHLPLEQPDTLDLGALARRFAEGLEPRTVGLAIENRAELRDRQEKETHPDSVTSGTSVAQVGEAPATPEDSAGVDEPTPGSEGPEASGDGTVDPDGGSGSR